ncbi:MAG: V-type ATPase subunit a family protein [Treponema sp.]|nr:V-type ATPase subunit a family protein [Treponema sp.]MCL2237858.1 V-type ATPase subunit a family protein [Treponema sp.]
MTLGERSAAGIKRLKLAEDSGACKFSDVVDKACEGLMDKQIKNSIRRIQEMERRLSGLEQELDAFLEQKVEGET